jgi:uncharacterized membrane protein
MMIMGGIGLLFIALFWGALILGGIWLLKGISFKGIQNRSGDSLSPREILDQRFARCEISREEYEQIKLDLN